MSHYGDYIKEREGRHILEKDFGFATFHFEGTDTCYIVDVYIEEMFRGERYAAQLCDDIALLAKEKKCKYLLTSVDPRTNGTTSSMLAILRYGFVLYDMDQRLIYFRKDL